MKLTRGEESPPGGNKSKESAERGMGSAIHHSAGRRPNEKPRARSACLTRCRRWFVSQGAAAVWHARGEMLIVRDELVGRGVVDELDGRLGAAVTVDE